jgi:hypothetical protein
MVTALFADTYSYKALSAVYPFCSFAGLMASAINGFVVIKRADKPPVPDDAAALLAEPS